MSIRKLLIINADDFGMSQAVNEGIVDAFRYGLVRSTSLMVNMPATEQAVLFANEFKSLEVGIHLNISEGFCVSPAKDVYLLADDKGCFNFDIKNIPESIRSLRWLVETKPEILKQISLEFENQINLFYKFGLKLSHINIHHYLALLHPTLFEIYVRTAEKFGIAYRGMCRPIFNLLNLSPQEDERVIAAIGKSVSVSSPGVSISHLLDGTPFALSNEDYCEMMKSKISELSQNDNLKSLELIVHPISDNFSGTYDEYATVKKIETFLVLNKDFGGYLKSSGFELHGYSGLLL